MGRTKIKQVPIPEATESQKPSTPLPVVQKNYDNTPNPIRIPPQRAIDIKKNDEIMVKIPLSLAQQTFNYLRTQPAGDVMMLFAKWMKVKQELISNSPKSSTDGQEIS